MARLRETLWFRARDSRRPRAGGMQVPVGGFVAAVERVSRALNQLASAASVASELAGQRLQPVHQERLMAPVPTYAVVEIRHSKVVRREGMDDRKAWENLDAARILLKHEASNAAASRAYYAAYQACWVAMMDKAGKSPPEVRRGVRYFMHDRLPYEAHEAGVLDEQGAQELDLLRSLRVEADYYEDDVTMEDAQEALAVGKNLVQRLLGERPEWLGKEPE